MRHTNRTTNLSQIVAYHLRKILNQQFAPGCYPVIVEGNLFYYVKLKCDTPMRVIIPLTPYVRGRERIKKKQAERIQSNLYPEISKYISESVGKEIQKAFSLSSLPLMNVDANSSQTFAI